MISFSLRYGAAFIISFVVLSIPLGNKSIFEHISDVTGPVGDDAKEYVVDGVKKSFSKTKKLGKSFFSNSKPQYVKDQVQNKQSSANKTIKNQNPAPQENITVQEARLLNNLIKNNQ